MPGEIPLWKTALKKVPGLVPLVRLGRLVADPRRRSEWLLQREKPENLFQPFSHTSFNRHPQIFSFISELLRDIPKPRLLSFGCSTGEEVFTLRKYFPEAEIVGIDINPRNIEVCKKKLEKSADAKIRFELANSTEAEPEDYFNAVFCLSVLRHGGLGISHPENCSHLIRFEDSAKAISGFHRVLRQGGYLAIIGSNFRFSDTTAAARFDVALGIGEAPRADTPIYGPDNRLLPNVAYNDVVFRLRNTTLE